MCRFLFYVMVDGAGGESKEGERLFESAEQRNLRKAQGISRTTQKVSTYSKRNSLHFKKFTSKVVNFLISPCLLCKLIL